jgi:hypothetical protein
LFSVEIFENAFNLNFERSVHLLCKIHLKKNIERKLIALGIQGRTKDDILADVFGRKRGEIFESGLFESGLATSSSISQFLHFTQQRLKKLV